MSAPVGSLSSGPACEAGKLIVQVIGKDHPASQKVVLCDDANKELKGKPEPQDKDLCSSVLHVWDCAGQAKRQLWLEIASTQGKPIRLPLLDNVRTTPRQADAQWNQLVPVLPFVALPGSKSAYDLGTPVLARAGYVYVFYQNKLWRELEVRITEGKTTYHDVDVAHYRQGKSFKAGERKASGQPLEDIWLPAIWNNQRVHDLRLCFCEIQLNAPRLQRLEQDAKLRDQRCKSFDLSCSNARFKERYKDKPDGKAMLQAFSNFDVRNYANQTAATQATVVRRNLDLGAFPLSVAAPQRPREPGYEWLLDHPGRYLCDLAGQFPATASQQAKAFLAQCAQGSSPERTELLELSAIADALEASLPAPKAEPGSKPEPAAETADLWQAQASVPDALTKARQRQICGILLEDPRYRLRHLKQRLETHHELLKLCARHATQQVNHASALLVQQLVVPRNLQGKPNPLHASLEKLGTKGKQDINRCTATVERAMVWQHMNSAQNLLAESFQQTMTQQALADHLSLDGFDYVSALFVISQTVAALAAPPSRLDPLAPSGDVVDAVSGVSLYSPKASPGQTYLASLANDANAPLHVMLWPECDMERVCTPYKVPTKTAENQGDGQFRATELAKNENKPAPTAEKQTTLDASIVANLLAGASFNSFLITSGKNLNGALLSIYDTLQGAVDTALAAIDTPRTAAAQAATDARTSNDASTQASERLERSRANLGARARPVNVRLHAQGVEQLRSMLPNTFGPAYFMRRSQVTQNYYLFGLEDLPSREAVPRTFYGEFLDRRGRLLGSTDRARMPATGVETAEHLVLVIPRNHSTAQLVSNMNKQLTAAQQSAAGASAANIRLTEANTALADALDQHSTRSNALAFRILNSRPFSVGVLMLELWNVNAEAQSVEQNTREKGSLRTVVGVTGSYIDLIIAMEALTVKLAGTQSVLASTRKTLFEISERNAEKWLGKTIAERITKAVTARLIAQSISGIVFAGLSLYDAWYAWQWNDNAMYGYLLMAGGALVGVASGLITATPVLGLHPLGWLALLLIGAGAGLVLWLSSTPLEDWLANGPFGSEGGSAAQHLLDPQEALYRLIGLLAGIGIKIDKNPLYQADAKLDPNGKYPFPVRTANTVIRIESRLPGLLGSIGSLGIQADCRLCEVVTTYFRGMPLPGEKKVPNTSSDFQAQRLHPDALELYVNTPTMVVRGTSGHGFLWAVRAQFVLKNQSESRYFPAPGVKDPTRYGPAYAKADFNKTNQPFWADEQTHKVQ
ncbi:hypothetical protein PUP68_31505 [Pseudomonas chlororaphis]|uniref:hypothetical protein n=1 Tax=Pseudomonas chlororaphis TaxID=587753 RepID=UPI0023683313|nr:hypothetical protein [Pseudomonas chlororaphis]WDG81644.1 hypothetical protein PUP77_13355 [Pseudomonas chlororaphis]WDG85303.1 hypothetical protein PUP68_31505 [Pseudomonas chlororaphis]